MLDPRGPLSHKILSSTVTPASSDVIATCYGIVLTVKLKSAEEKRGAYNKYVTIFQSKAKFKAKVVANMCYGK